MTIDYDFWDKVFELRDSIPDKKPFKRMEYYIDMENQKRCTKCGCSDDFGNCFECRMESDYLRERDKV